MNRSSTPHMSLKVKNFPLFSMLHFFFNNKKRLKKEYMEMAENFYLETL